MGMFENVHEMVERANKWHEWAESVVTQHEKESFLDRGYKIFEGNALHESYERICFQKCFYDDVGKKYFVTVYRHLNRDLGEKEIHYSYDIQLYRGKDRLPINLLFFAGWDVEDVERDVEAIFTTGGYEYYETKEEY